jgi:hypothetical protein
MLRRLVPTLASLMILATLARADVPDTTNCYATIRDPHPFTVAPCGGDPMPVVDVFLLSYPDELPFEVIAADIWLHDYGLALCGTVNADSSTFAPDPGHTTISGIHPMYLLPGQACTAAQVDVIFSGDVIERLEFSVNGPDLSGDGEVTVTDFSLFGPLWLGTSPCADFYEDGVVNLSDFAAFASWFNHCSCD